MRYGPRSSPTISVPLTGSRLLTGPEGGLHAWTNSTSARTRRREDIMNKGARDYVTPSESMSGGACALLASALLLAAPTRRGAEPPKLPVPAVDQSAIPQRGYFYVGGKYTGEPGKDIMQGQVYVEWRKGW